MRAFGKEKYRSLIDLNETDTTFDQKANFLSFKVSTDGKFGMTFFCYIWEKAAFANKQNPLKNELLPMNSSSLLSMPELQPLFFITLPFHELFIILKFTISVSSLQC